MSQGKHQETQEVYPSSLRWDEPEDPYLSSFTWDEQVELEEKRLEGMQNENLLNRENIMFLMQENERKSAELENRLTCFKKRNALLRRNNVISKTKRIRNSKESLMKLWEKKWRNEERDAVQTQRHGDKIQLSSR